MRESPGQGPSDANLEEIRRLANRKRAFGQKVRRVLPGLVVGSATLTGTGALAAWVGNQPGVHTVSSVTSTPPTTVASLAPIAQQLQTDEQEVSALQSALANLQKQRATNATRAGGATPGGASIGPLPPLPAIPSVSIRPAPTVNATTGASHAVP